MPFYRKSSTMVPERDMEDQPAYSVTQIGVVSEEDDAGDRRVESIVLPRDGRGHCPKSIANLGRTPSTTSSISSIPFDQPDEERSRKAGHLICNVGPSTEPTLCEMFFLVWKSLEVYQSCILAS